MSQPPQHGCGGTSAHVARGHPARRGSGCAPRRRTSYPGNRRHVA
ncbi:hypothetical protein Salmuc_00801 [Salipiger mucosus DSM 16094]|uniref:Uncharacterized protein n=1 Tax=Salipiger mucosus DSM 16094 TaxID=1123237 RepID=S9S711_9RHOB|nr:hypothetical protein Salmuc_00801 [Salipiger mucosus DSM 16094]